jgi:transposase
MPTKHNAISRSETKCSSVPSINERSIAIGEAPSPAEAPPTGPADTLQAIALNHALRQRRALCSQVGQKALQALALPPHPRQRRMELLSLYVLLQKRISVLDRQVEEQAKQRPTTLRLLTHPGVGPLTASATEMFMGDPSRSENGKAVAQ